MSSLGISKLFIKLSKPPPKLAWQLHQWGIAFKDAKGNMLPLATIMENVSKAAKKSGGNFNQVAFLAELVGAKSEKAAIALTEMFDSGRYGKLAESLKDANGEVQKMGKIRGDNIRGDVTKIRARIRDISDAIFDLGKGPLRELTSDTLHWIDANKEIIKTKATEYAHDFAAALPKIIDRIERLWPLVKVIGEISAAIWTVNKATASWTVLSEMNPWVLGLTAVLIAATALVEFWPEIKRFFDEHQLAIALVSSALIGLGVAMYGPTGLNIAIAGITKAIKVIGPEAELAAWKLAGINKVQFVGLLGTLGAITMAIEAIVALIDQVEKFEAENKGGLIGTLNNMGNYGTLNPFEANDIAANEEAVHQSTGSNHGAQVLAPRAHGSIDWANGLGGGDESGGGSLSELVITDESGKAKWKTPPKKGSGIRLARPSGAL